MTPACASPSPAPSPAIYLQPACRCTILLVEDEAAIRQLARRALERCGYAVLEASSGPAAVQLARGYHSPIDLVIADMVLPQLHGCAVAQEIARQHPEVRILLMTGCPDALAWAGGGGTPVTDAPVLRKPFALGDLCDRVREVLRSAPTQIPISFPHPAPVEPSAPGCSA